MENMDLKQHAQEKIQHYLQLACVYFNRDFPLPTLNFKLKGQAAGKAYLQTNEIRLNPILFTANLQAFFNEVIPHEVAHLIAYQLYGHVRPHGKEWQNIMTLVFHLQAKTTHQFDLTCLPIKTFNYRCKCKSHTLSIRRHNKVQRQQNNYVCKICQHILIFTSQQAS